MTFSYLPRPSAPPLLVILLLGLTLLVLVALLVTVIGDRAPALEQIEFWQVTAQRATHYPSPIPYLRPL